ncbi:MAG: hypothetical protein RL462_6 [Pseudomonadota bacterium]|jgi:DNA-binding transcriptional LysR family regulator
MKNINRIFRSNLKLKHLQLLVALDQLRHLGKTAEYLAVTQPAVSKTLAEIERMFELVLFNRSTRGTEPTPAGESIIRFAKNVLSEFERTKEELEDTSSGTSGKINVGVMVVAMPTLLSPAIAKLKTDSPATRVTIEEGDLTRLLPRLRSGEIDLLVGRLEPGYAAPDLKTEPLYKEPMCLVVQRHHMLTKKKKIAWADLVDCAWVVPPIWASSRTKLIQVFHQHGLNPPGNFIESASFMVIFNEIIDHDAIGFVAHQVGRHFEKKGDFKILPVPLKMDLPPVGLMTMHGRKVKPSTQKLIDTIKSVSRLKK